MASPPECVFFLKKKVRSLASGRLPCGVFAKPKQLFVVMASMHHMQFSPLWRGQRAQDRVVEHVNPAAEACFTLRDDGIHLPDHVAELGAYLLHWQAFRHRHRRGF